MDLQFGLLFSLDVGSVSGTTCMMPCVFSPSEPAFAARQLYVHSTSPETFLKLRSLPELAGLDMVNTAQDTEGTLRRCAGDAGDCPLYQRIPRGWNVGPDLYMVANSHQ